MSTPVDERGEPQYGQGQRDRSYDTGVHDAIETSLPAYNVHHRPSQEKSSDEEATMVADADHVLEQEKEKEHIQRRRAASHLTVPDDYDPGDPLRTLQSPSQGREQATRLNDDLALLQIERQVSRQALDAERSRSRAGRSRVREEHVDEFDEATNPVHEQTAVYKPPEHPASGFGKFMKRLHASNWIVRYVTYIAPLTIILLIPLLVGALVTKNATVGGPDGVTLVWFMIWLEIVWLTLWLGRIIAKALPWPIGVASSLFTNNSKKWRDMGKQLELPATLFFWWLAIEVSFLPTLTNHQVGHDSSYIPDWMVTMNKVLVSIFVGVTLNFIEKIIIQLIAISFHLRTYADRIELNKFQIGSLTKLYKYSKEKIAMEDYEFELPSGGPGSGARTPGQFVADAAKQTRQAFGKFGDIAGKVAGDFTGKQVTKSTHPSQVILALLNSVSGSQVLARRLYRTFAREDTETVLSDDLKAAFDSDDEATAAFSMFDKDLNGDISMEELEAVCVEIGRERKSITASLKDLDSVVGKLDDVFMFIVLIITVLVFISLISTSAAGVLTSAGSAVLALSWLFSATAQEFLQSCIFVFVKHPFDVGDRVTIYGNTGAALKGDDYFVKEISLLYTEFKKMEGHIVQAPNSYLNTLFILNQRRSGGLAEALTLTIKFGTTLQQIEGLRNKLLEFVQSEKREYQNNILTELRNITDVYSMDLNVVFFYKSNWQNEGLRLARRNKFLCALMVAFQELGIEGPQMRMPGQRQSYPVYLQNIPHQAVPGAGYGGHPDNPYGIEHGQEGPQDPPFVAPHDAPEPSHSRMRNGSVMRPRAESIAAMNKRVDFSLGMSALATSDLGGDVYESRERERIPIHITEASQSRVRAAEAQRRQSEDIARSTSRELTQGLMRRSTDKSSIHPRHSLHRNRFLSRRAGTTDEQAAMESGMADIPENPGSGGPSTARIDPRSGLISPAAWRLRTNESNIRPEVMDSPLEEVETPNVRLGRSLTDGFEMRRFR
ncbi:hypothetical protein AMS68_003686 [Peltaster fructicola]|uniref:Mechanosensitive ion channel protein n=1 Tax=Peltaster fructicola TaxID=286661 RepID=A0A6H0XU70_9PEZI|nr:hypothetical protein AMS68_003686 [Peltaster fructicola]